MKIENSMANQYGKTNTPAGNAQSTIERVEIKKPVISNETEINGNISSKPEQELTIGEKKWIQLIEQANKAINGANKSFEYSIHEKTKQIMVKVIDTETKEIIREIPSEKILDLVAKLWEVSGLFVDERR